jgi:hypothetical protein
VTSAHFVKTPLYIQLMALGDFTKVRGRVLPQWPTL